MFRKIFKICFWSIGPILLVCLIFRCNYHHRIASDYNRVLDKMNLSLPSVKHVETSNNYDRGASRWDCLEYYIQFESPLPERTIKQLERRAQRSLNNWFREDRQSCIVYTYVSEREWQITKNWEETELLTELLQTPRLIRIVRKLHEHERKILYARIFGELSFEELGEIFHKTPYQMEMSYCYILRKLKKELGGHKDEI